jgi:hypothetical protein
LFLPAAVAKSPCAEIVRACLRQVTMICEIAVRNAERSLPTIEMGCEVAIDEI